jgi:hypothetical protein
VSGWDARNVAPYGFAIFPLSSSLNYAPAPINSYADMYHYLITTRYDQGIPWAYTAINQHQIPAWKADHPYVCNSWTVVVYSGVGQGQSGAPPVAGDVINLTIVNGHLPAGKVVLHHTVTSGEIPTATPDSSPYATDLVNQINANGSLATAGITAGTRCSDPHTYVTSNGGDGGMFFINFNSASIGDIVVSASVTGRGPETVWCIPNGDSILNSSDPAMFNRPRLYLAGTTGTSGSSGPTGTGNAITDGTIKWYYGPEWRAQGWYNPYNPSLFPAFPAFINSSYYVLEYRAGMTILAAAGISGASAAMATLDAMFKWWFAKGNPKDHLSWRNTLDARAYV